jgi:hypothetical protein
MLFLGSTLTEQKKMELMKLMGEHFKTYPYIKGTVLWTLTQIGTALLIVAASYFSLAPLKKRKLYKDDGVFMVRLFHPSANKLF